jgi:hypothetical protein
MALLLLLVLAVIPLIGVVWIVAFRSVFTVDGLFMSLILLAMSGIVGTTALFEFKHRMSGVALAGGGAMPAGHMQYPGELMHRGKVQEVVFYEANVGQPNKSIITLADGDAPQTLVLEGDLRNALPIGQKVRIIMRKEQGQNVLVNLSYS